MSQKTKTKAKPKPKAKVQPKAKPKAKAKAKPNAKAKASTPRKKAKTSSKTIKKRPAPKNVGGRPRYEVDYQTLIGLCKINCTGEECAAVLNVDYDTLDRALKRDGEGGFAEYLKKKRASGRVSLRRAQWKEAMDNEGKGSAATRVKMLIHLGKNELGQTDRVETNVDIPSEVKRGLNSFYEDLENGDA